MEIRISRELERFNHLMGEIDGLYHDAAVALGLSESAMKVLYTICCHGERCPLRAICRQSGMSKQTVNSALRKLEGAGAVYLEAAGGRSKNVCLTDAGRELADGGAPDGAGGRDFFRLGSGRGGTVYPADPAVSGGLSGEVGAVSNTKRAGAREGVRPGRIA